MRAKIGATVAVVATVVSLAGGLAGPLYAVFGAN
jgi:predicted small lipoprotein YifL